MQPLGDQELESSGPDFQAGNPHTVLKARNGNSRVVNRKISVG